MYNLHSKGKDMRGKRVEGENLGDDANALAAKKMAKVELPMFFDDMKKKVLGDKDKENAKIKASNMSKAELEKYEKSLLKKQWQNVTRGVVRIYRFTQK